MTPRERWLSAGLVVSVFGLAGVGLWNQARYGDLRDAVNRYVALDERQEKESPENAAYLRQARPEIRRSLARGEFEAALKRLKALEEEDAATAPGSHGQALPIAQLWPPNSPERKKLQTALADLVRKQSEGYDVSPAQQKLAEVAEAARAGKRDEALAAFEQAAALIQGAPFRPGFKPKVRLAAGSTLTPAEQQVIDRAMQQIRGYRDAFPQLLAQPSVTDRQRQVLGQAKLLFDELLTAYDGKRDLRPVLRLLDPLKQAFDQAGQTQEWGPVEKLIETSRKQVKALPLLAGAPAQPAAPGNPGTLPAPKTSPPPTASAPVLPPASTPGQPGMPNAEAVLRLLDMIRALPEERYQAEKPKIRTGLLQLLGTARPGSPAPAGEPVGKDLQLLLGPQGEIYGLRLFGEPLSAAGKQPGGVSVQLGEGSELPVRAPVIHQGAERRFRVESPAGAVTVQVKPGVRDLTLKVAGRRTQAGGPAFLTLTLPIPLGGWTWQPGPEAQTIAVDRDYRLQSSGRSLPTLVLRGGTTELAVEAPTASEVTYLRGEGRLRIQFPLPHEAGSVEHTVQLGCARRSPGTGN